MMMAIHRHLTSEGFFWVNTPIITTSDAEGAGDMFRLSTLDLANLPRTDEGKVDYRKDFFGREAFLTVSGQLNVEAYCLAMSKVYTFGPTFRAENSNTPRHLAACWRSAPTTWRSSPSACCPTRSAAWKTSSPSRSSASTTPTRSKS
jgi:asparaginyl-tRNA synthetase